MNIDEQVALLMQGTEYGDDELKATMANELLERLQLAQMENRPLRVYCGYDPTKADLHLGHTITMRKLRQFQELGHDVTFVIGTYTSLIGDPSDKGGLRPRLTEKEVEENAWSYAEQAFRILDREKTKVRYNAEWLSKLTLAELIQLGSNFTIQQMLTRENFKLRWEKGDAVFLHETFYALMQGYDAHVLKTDVQVGGSDQLFNIITAARKVMMSYGDRPNIGVIMGILPGTDGVVRMSKSLGNHIPIDTTAEDMYGKLMSIPDFAMPLYFKLLTNRTPREIEEFETGIKNGDINPRDLKMKLAMDVTESFYGKTDTEKAQNIFIKTFQKHEIPQDLEEYRLKAGQSLVDVLLDARLAVSKSEAKRLIDQKGVKLDGVPLLDATQKFPHPGILQVGKRRYVRVR